MIAIFIEASRRHHLGLLEGATVSEIDRDPGCPEGVASRFTIPAALARRWIISKAFLGAIGRGESPPFLPVAARNSGLFCSSASPPHIRQGTTLSCGAPASRGFFRLSRGASTTSSCPVGNTTRIARAALIPANRMFASAAIQTEESLKMRPFASDGSGQPGGCPRPPFEACIARWRSIPLLSVKHGTHLGCCFVVLHRSRSSCR
jgi:hypothetical protein